MQCMCHSACALGFLLPCRSLQRLCLPMPARRGSWPPCLCPTCTSCSLTLLSTQPRLQQVCFRSFCLAMLTCCFWRNNAGWQLSWLKAAAHGLHTLVGVPVCVMLAGAGGMAAPDLEMFSREVERLQLAAQEVEELCSHTVRTGACCHCPGLSFTAMVRAAAAGCAPPLAGYHHRCASAALLLPRAVLSPVPQAEGPAHSSLSSSRAAAAAGCVQRSA